MRREVLPVARNLGEIKGLLNNVIGRLERLEQELIAERNARLDDLTLLVDLVSTGWQGVDRRLERIELGETGRDRVAARSRRRCVVGATSSRRRIAAQVTAHPATVARIGQSPSSTFSGSSPASWRCSSWR